MRRGVHANRHSCIHFKYAHRLYTELPRLICRGQVVRVKAPWVKHYYNNNGQFYVIPNLETVVLGGTTQKGSWDTSINEQVLVHRHPLLLHWYTKMQYCWGT